MSLNNKSPDHHIAYAAITEVLDAACVIGRYWWNLQMRFLIATGTMRLFKAHWWLFFVLGFLLLAFLFPLGVAFVTSAFLAVRVDPPRAEDNFIVALRQKQGERDIRAKDAAMNHRVSEQQPEGMDYVRTAASLHHVGYLNAIKRDLEDKEIAAAALGAFDGTVQAFGLKVSDFDMHTNGAAFIVAQLTSLERIDEIDPEWIAEVTEEAMTSKALEAIRVEAGRFAFTMEGAMRDGPEQPTG